MSMQKYFSVLAVFSFVCIATVGCSENSDLARVEGTVTLDGEPLPDALVVFSPTSGGTTSYGRTDEEGRYELYFSDSEAGAYIGENRVRITTGDVDPTMEGPGTPELVPSVYNEETTLVVEVTPSLNEHNFALDSDAGPLTKDAAE